jgi:heat-inducible transcriptional repressor
MERGTNELTERQREILEYVIEDYVAEGLPVGSKALTSRRALPVSASTVRYELAELEELGYLTHPHTSAGRVPTDQGYRFYADRLLDTAGSRPAAVLIDLSGVRNEIGSALRATVDALTQVSQLLAMATAPPLETTVVRHVEVLLLQPQVVVTVIISSTGGVCKRVAVFDEPVDPKLVEWAGDYLAEQVHGLTVGGRALRQRISDPGLAPRERTFLDALSSAFTELAANAEEGVYIGGTATLVNELGDGDIATFRGILETLERRAAVLDLLRLALDTRRPVVRVGGEFDDPGFAKLALVAAPYGLTNRNLGTVSLLGPARMDYGKSIEAVRSAASQLSRFVEELYEE